MTIDRVARAVLAACLIAGGSACTDPMVVGERPACEAECAGGLHCDIEVQRCVQCKVDDDCADRRNAPYCEGFGCVQCRSTADCTGGRTCSAGACVQCIEDADCNNGAEPFEVHLCQFGSCVDRRP
jgi:hypothetical protein